MSDAELEEADRRARAGESPLPPPTASPTATADDSSPMSSDGEKPKRGSRIRRPAAPTALTSSTPLLPAVLSPQHHLQHQLQQQHAIATSAAALPAPASSTLKTLSSSPMRALQAR